MPAWSDAGLSLYNSIIDEWIKDMSQQATGLKSPLIKGSVLEDALFVEALAAGGTDLAVRMYSLSMREFALACGVRSSID